MSLSIYLTQKYQLTYDDGKTFIDKEDTVFKTNITHNLNEMADKAGIYYALWRPEEIQKEKAGELIELLEKGLSELKLKPDYFKQFNASNGWGLYEHFVPFVEEYLEACKNYPESQIEVSP